MSDPSMLRTLRFDLDVNGTVHPVSMPDVSCRMEGEMELYFLVDPLTLAATVVNGSMTTRHVAAAVWLSKRQAGEPVDPDGLLDSVTLGDEVKVTRPADVVPSTDLDADPNS